MIILQKYGCYLDKNMGKIKAMRSPVLKRPSDKK